MLKLKPTSGSRGRRSQRGGALTDVMISIVVTCATVLSIVPLNLASSRTMARSRNIEVATQAARQYIEQYRRAGYAALPAISSGQSAATITLAAPATLPGGTARAVFTKVDRNLAVSTTAVDRRHLEVRVAWTGEGKNAGNVTLITLLTDD